MIPRLRHVVVLGAGTMGAQLACLVAGTGADVRLLDVDADAARSGLERARGLRPSAVYRQTDLERVRPGGFEELEDAVRAADWVLEAVVERADAKRALFERVDSVLTDVAAEPTVAGAVPLRPIVSSNTSGLSIRSLAEGRSDAFRRRFLGTHFFNPPRYARLLELVPTEATDPGCLAWVAALASRSLGKATVRAKDTPAFIANRLGVHGMLTALALAQELGLGVDQVDELTGPLLGRPKSATFRTLDLVGLDVAVAVADHCREALVDDPERDRFEVPPVLRGLVADGRLGEKTGAGFYLRRDGEILALDLETGEYRPRRTVASPVVEMARAEPDLRRRLATLLGATRRATGDAASCFIERLLASGLGYAATVGPEVADDAAAVDEAIRWGFGWELGPFETWDVIGHEAVRATLARVPPLIERVDAGPRAFRSDGAWLDFGTLALARHGRDVGRDLDERRRTVPDLPSNASASLVDLGDGILGLELHGRHGVIGLDTVDLLRRGVDLASERYDGLVVGTRGPDLSLGANLALLLIEADDGEWDELDRAVRRFQAATTSLREASVPTVVASRGRTLGGGAELCLAAARCQPLAETYIGLVETGVGLIPAGGGTAEMARRAGSALPDGAAGDTFPFFRHALETIAFARVSTSAAEASSLGLLRPCDLVTADPERQWRDAKATARHLADVGYRRPDGSTIRVAGRRAIAAAEALTYNELRAGRMSVHDRTVTLELARVMAGGDVADGTLLADAYLLDLEREAFLRLLGERLTRDRMRYTLRTGKPLRN